MVEIFASVCICIVIVVALIIYLRAGYHICSEYRGVGQRLANFFAFIDRSKKFTKKVKTRRIKPSRVAFIKCVICAPARFLLYKCLPKKPKKRVVARRH